MEGMCITVTLLIFFLLEKYYFVQLNRFIARYHPCM